MHRFNVKLVLLINFILLDELIRIVVLRSLDVELLLQRLVLRSLLLSPSLVLWGLLVLHLILQLHIILILLFFHRVNLEILVRLRERHVNLLGLLIWIYGVFLDVLLVHLSIEYLVLTRS